VWNQAGVDTTGTTSITIDSPGAATQASAADFVRPGVVSADVVASGNAAAGSIMLGDTHQPPIGVPPLLHS
jgi:hypothetical protein